MPLEQPTLNRMTRHSTWRETPVCKIVKTSTCYENTLEGWIHPRLTLLAKAQSIKIPGESPTVRRMLAAKPRGAPR